MADIRVNIVNKVDANKIRVENVEGEPHLIIPSYTLPDNAVLNGLYYSKEEVDRAWPTINNTMAPVGHPTNSEGEWISAFSPAAIHNFHGGAWNRNARRENGRVYVEKVVNIRYAQSVEPGRRLLEAVRYNAETGEAAGPESPIHTSTGLVLQQEEAPEGSPYKYIARNMRLDHDAILLDEVGAATPDQGIGMMVNSAEAIQLTADGNLPDAEPSWFKGFVANLLAVVAPSKAPITTNQPGEDESMPLSKEDLEALGQIVSNALAPITERLDKHGEELTSLKTNSDALAEQVKTNAEKQVTADRALVAEKHGEAVANALPAEKLAEIANALRAGTAGEELPNGERQQNNAADDTWGLVPTVEGK